MNKTILSTLLFLSIVNISANPPCTLENVIYRPEHIADNALKSKHPMYYIVKFFYLSQKNYINNNCLRTLRLNSLDTLKKEIKTRTVGSIALTELENAILGDRFSEYMDQHYEIIYLDKDRKKLSDLDLKLKLFIMVEKTDEGEKDILYIVQLEDYYPGVAWNLADNYSRSHREK